MIVTVELTDAAAVALTQLIDNEQNRTGYDEVLDSAWFALMDQVGSAVVCLCPPMNEELEYLHEAPPLLQELEDEHAREIRYAGGEI